MRLEAAVGGAVFSATVLCSAAFGHDIAHGLHRRHADLHLHMKRDPEPSRTIPLYKRVASSETSFPAVSTGDVFNAPLWPTVTIPAGFTLAGGVEVTSLPAADIPTGSVALSSLAAVTQAADPATWNAQADQACSGVVMKLNGQAGNPSGMVACYNVPFLDTQKGTFEAELRIFNVSMPSGDFAGTSATNMMVTFKFQSASVQASDGTLPVKRALIERQSTPTATTGAAGNFIPMEISVRKYVGQISPASFTPGMSQDSFKTILTPQISISAVSPSTKQTISTDVSSNQASFVAGVFATATGNLTDPKYLLDKPAEKLAAAAQGLPTPFIVPGLSLGVFPVGLIVALVWLVGFSTAVGLGTLGRIQFREQYRSAIRAQMSGDVKRI
ncbi:hypothetical protein BT63DRAFT_414486 [Microthyrium microscopicum]|uniref:Uncharacterized protein n=1 Tax=Microthyrium microscopicum TaxID=703497 RepID=A0A6A6UA60_9PEZI|nr:hypothetical protein BT63DRAFT_414486 [Microthyrium microscopicum]